jgi:photosystem II stability/assembly factor-like uncharacterized protein
MVALLTGIVAGCNHSSTDSTPPDGAPAADATAPDGAPPADFANSPSWRLLSSGTTSDLNSIAGRNTDELFVAGSGGTILHSVDAGDHWAPLATVTTADLFGVAAAPDRVIAVGQNGLAILSTDAGAHWTAQNTSTANDLRAVLIVSSSAWVVGDNGTLLHSSDGGGSWNLEMVPTTSDLLAIAAFGDDLSITGRNGAILQSIKSAPWTLLPSGTTADLSGTTGHEAVGALGTMLIYSSTSSTPEAQVTSSGLHAIAAVGAGECFGVVSVGGNGTILTACEFGGWAWRVEPASSLADLRGVFGVNGKTFIVGAGGTILSRDIWM